jgi:hypothetical protein
MKFGGRRLKVLCHLAGCRIGGRRKGMENAELLFLFSGVAEVSRGQVGEDDPICLGCFVLGRSVNRREIHKTRKRSQASWGAILKPCEFVMVP